jgi:hypothetical protein
MGGDTAVASWGRTINAAGLLHLWPGLFSLTVCLLFPGKSRYHEGRKMIFSEEGHGA